MDESPGAGDWVAVGDAVRERLRELGMTKAELARETGLSETTVRYLGRSPAHHHKSALIAISVVLRWRRDHLLNILHRHPEKNAHAAPPGTAALERLLRAETASLKDELSRLLDTANAVDRKAGQLLPHRLTAPGRVKGEGLNPMDPITSLPAPDDMDADYSPQYVKLARILRDKIKTGQLNHPTALRGTVVAAKYGVSAQVAHAALEMLAANRYITRPPGTRYYHVGPQATANDRRARG